MLRDRQAQRRILSKLDVLAKSGDTGPTRSVGDDVFETKLYFGPGYRLYYQMRGATLVLLLTGGDKDSQANDILAAKRIAKQLETQGDLRG